MNVHRTGQQRQLIVLCMFTKHCSGGGHFNAVLSSVFSRQCLQRGLQEVRSSSVDRVDGARSVCGERKTSVSNLDVRILSVLTTGRSKDSGRPSGNIAFMKRSSAIKMAISRATVT